MTDETLSPHFTLAELTASDTAAAHGLDNAPPPAAIANLRRLVDQVLEPVRAKFGIVRVTSGYRCAALNRLVGGAPGSQHVAGEAADIVCPALGAGGLAAWIAHALPFDQLILEAARTGRSEAPWVHVSFSRHALRGDVLTRRPDGSYARGLLLINPDGRRHG